MTIIPDTGLGIILSNPPGTTSTVVGGTVTVLPSVANSLSMLVYTAGGGTLFPSLPDDLILEPGLYHSGNPLLTDIFQVPSYNSLNVSVEALNVYSTQTEMGIFDVVYPASGVVDGGIQYYWDDIYTSPLGIYQQQSSPATWNINLSQNVLTFQTNDVNTIPRITDYITFNYVPIYYTGFTNGSLPIRLPYFKGTEFFMAQITDVLIVSGSGTGVVYQLTLDKSFNFESGDNFGVVLLNRTNTSIQKELFYKTFEQVEVHRQQLLGDPYNNQTNTALPSGRMNHLNYGDANALGMQNLLSGIINSTTTPFVFFDVNDEIKDRFSFAGNSYDSNNKPTDIHFEFHLPFVMMNTNLFPAASGTTASPVNSSGGILENILITNPNQLTVNNDSNIGLYSGLYLKSDTSFANRYGYVFYDLRIVVIDDPELATALGYNSNRNYTLPAPVFQSGSGNNIMNPGQGTNLSITNVSNTSPMVVTTSAPFALTPGTQVVVTGVFGNTAANGTYFIDNVYGAPNIYMFELWEQMPQYVGTVRVAGTGVPSAGNGLFVNNGIGMSGTIIGAQPQYSYFYTYRIRDTRNNSTMPYASVTDFNFTTAGSVDNTNGSLFVNIPMFNWYNQQNNLLPYDLGFQLFQNSVDIGYGIDLIVGQYMTNPFDPINPTAILGIKNVMCIPLKKLVIPFTGSPINGISLQLSLTQDYNAAVASSASTLVGSIDYTFDLYENMPLYSYNVSSLPSTLLTANGQWTIGNFIYRNHVNINRANFAITVPANSWNNSTNPSYTPSTNPLISDKYITEVAILLNEQLSGNNDLTPMVYAKIAPPIDKTQNLDLLISINVDF